jgi:hypothetical protein
MMMEPIADYPELRGVFASNMVMAIVLFSATGLGSTLWMATGWCPIPGQSRNTWKIVRDRNPTLSGRCYGILVGENATLSSRRRGPYV